MVKWGAGQEWHDMLERDVGAGRGRGPFGFPEFGTGAGWMSGWVAGRMPGRVPGCTSEVLK